MPSSEGGDDGLFFFSLIGGGSGRITKQFAAVAFPFL